MNPLDVILVGDVREKLKELPDDYVHCVVTSPPYWGLRDYGVAGQLGLEDTPAEYVARMVEVFREVRRVMRPDATLWLNLGDSYAGSGRGRNSDGEHSHKKTDKQASNRGSIAGRLLRPAAPSHGLHTTAVQDGAIGANWVPPPPGLKPKDLVGIPWRVAFALQADGWWLRQDIIWSKPNPMPESVSDRCTKAHEYLFLLGKSEHYYFDGEAIREPATYGNHHRNITEPKKYAAVPAPRQRGHKGLWKTEGVEAGRNKRSVWTVNTQPYRDAHFATFPEQLVAPCLMAGTSERGCCALCGAPWERRVEVEYENPGNRSTNGPRSEDRKHKEYGSAGYAVRLQKIVTTKDWQPTCGCFGTFVTIHHPPPPRVVEDVGEAEADGFTDRIYKPGPTPPATAPCIVLDPFMGSGTTALVALKAGRQFVGVELNPEYAEMARRRIGPELHQLKLA